MRWWHSLIIVVTTVVVFLAGYLLGVGDYSLFKGLIYNGKYSVFKDLLIVLLSILAVFIAAFAVGAFLLLRQILIGIADATAQQRANEVLRRATQRFVLQFLKLETMLGYQKWQEWTDWMEERGKEKEPGGTPTKDHLLDHAIHASQDVLQFVQDSLMEVLDEKEYQDFWQRSENREHLMRAKNNLAYYLADRGRIEDRKMAKELAIEIYREARSQPVANYQWLDTVAWVLKRLPLTEDDRQESQ